MLKHPHIRIIEIAVPVSAEIPNLSGFSPEENAEMLKIGGEYVIRANKYAVGEKVMNRLRDEVKSEYDATIRALETQVKTTEAIEEYLAANADETQRKEIEKLRAELAAMERKMRQSEEAYEARLEREIQRERKHAKTLSDEWEKRVEVYRKNEEKMGAVVEFINARKNNTELGMEGEKEIQEICCLAFRDIDGFEIKDVHTQKAKGDYHLEFKNMTILVDSKLYSGLVSAQEREKIKRDLMANHNIHFAWLVSMDTPVSKFDKGVFAFEWIAKDKCVCYVNSIRKSGKPVEVVRSLYFVCKMLYEQVIVYAQTVANAGENEEKEMNAKMNALEKFRENVVANLEKYQKLVREREKAMRELKDAMSSQDELVRISLNSSTAEFVGGYYTKVYEWWCANVCEKNGNVLSSQQLWARYKRDTKEQGGAEGSGGGEMNVEVFKEILVLFAKEFNKTGGKGGKLEILDVDFVEATTSASASPPPPEAKTSELKMNRKWTKEDIAQLNNLFNDGKTVFELAKELKRSEGGILTQLKKNGVIDKYSHAHGYEEYRISAQFNKYYAD